MITIKDAKRYAKNIGAKIVISELNNYDQSYTIEAEAPDGKQWIVSGGQILVSIWYTYANGDKEKAIIDIIHRMMLGLEDLEE